MRRSLSLDLVASVLGRGLSAGLLFLFTPVYISRMGVEAYGLFGFYAVLLASCMFLDQAISPVVSRRFAQASARGPLEPDLWNTFRTVEIVALAIGSLIALGIVAAAPWIADDMLRATTMTAPRVRGAVQLMALLLLAQWPSFLYGAALAGLGDQAAMNVLRGGAAMLQWVGGALVLIFLSPTIEALLLWQTFCFALQGVLLRRRVSHNLRPPTAPLAWDGRLLRDGWRFSAGTLVIGITGTVLTQADKLFVSKMAALGDFAAYTLSFTVASIVGVFVAQPVMAIAFPHFTRLAATGPEDALAREYRRWTQLIVLVIVPPVGALIFYSHEILALWLGSGRVGLEAAARYIPWIALGTMFNVLMMLPFNLQLAHGWTSLSARKNLLILPIYLILLWWGIPLWGPIVGATAWLGVNALYYLFEVPLVHRRLLRTSMWHWWLLDTGLPCLTGLVLFWAIRAAFTAWIALPALLVCSIAIVVVASSLLAVLPEGRRAAKNILRRFAPSPASASPP